MAKRRVRNSFESYLSNCYERSVFFFPVFFSKLLFVHGGEKNVFPLPIGTTTFEC